MLLEVNRDHACTTWIHRQNQKNERKDLTKMATYSPSHDTFQKIHSFYRCDDDEDTPHPHRELEKVHTMSYSAITSSSISTILEQTSF